MAKSCLNLKGAKAPKLELDFFKLAYAVTSLRDAGQQAVGYLQVLTEAVRDRANLWVSKYSTGDAVIVLYAPPSHNEFAALAAEKARNALGLLTTKQDEQRVEEGLSLASLGEELGETALILGVTQLHPSVSRITDFSRFPMQIDWDFYGMA